MTPEFRKTLIISAIVVLIQVILAPIITIGGVVPNFLAAYVVVTVLAQPERKHYTLAFVMGLIYDLLSTAPIGSMAFCLVAAAFLLSILQSNLGGDNLLMVIVMVVCSMLAINIVHAVFVVMAGSVSFGQAFLLRALPCTLYDSVLAVPMFMLLSGVLSGGSGGSGQQVSQSKMNMTDNIRF